MKETAQVLAYTALSTVLKRISELSNESDRDGDRSLRLAQAAATLLPMSKKGRR